MNLKKLYFVLFISVAISLGSCNSTNTAPASAKKTDSLSTAQAAAPCGCCAELLQSPVKIDEHAAIMAELPKLTFYAEPTPMTLVYEAKAIKIMPTLISNNNNYVVFNSRRYFFKEFHFHYKAEHWIDGVREPMEMHVVYEDKATGAAVVAGLLIDNVGTEPNTVLGDIWNQFPDSGRYQRKPLEAKIDLSKIINYIDKDVYYTYVGSLTTSPYTEGIAWIVFKKKIGLTGKQIEKFGYYYPKSSRDPLPINNRLIYTNK